MNTKIEIRIPSFLSVNLTVVTLLCILNSCAPEEAKSRIGKIPPFEIQLLDGSIFTGKDVAPGKPTVFVFFESHCEHCLSEIQDFSSNGSQLKNISVFLISAESLDTLKLFSGKWGLDKFPSIHIASDKDGKWEKSFHPKGSPVNYIYDGNRNLLKRMNREMKVAEILQIVKAN